MIDLHMHSRHSIDGHDSPEAMIGRAAERGMKAVAITDHNSVAGIEEGRSVAENAGIEFVSGVEINGCLDIEGIRTEAHILGYFIKNDAPNVGRMAAGVVERDRRQADAALVGLAKMGIPVSREVVEENMPGRHSTWAVRRLLCEKGHARGKPEAAAIMIQAWTAAAEVDSQWRFVQETPSAEAVIKAIKADGGLALMAHPFWLTAAERGGFSEDYVWRQIDAMRALGIDGIEAYNTGNDGGYSQRILAYCREHGMPASGGSDAHGVRHAGVCTAELSLLESMRRYRAGLAPW